MVIQTNLGRVWYIPYDHLILLHHADHISVTSWYIVIQVKPIGDGISSANDKQALINVVAVYFRAPYQFRYLSISRHEVAKSNLQFETSLIVHFYTLHSGHSYSWHQMYSSP